MNIKDIVCGSCKKNYTAQELRGAHECIGLQGRFLAETEDVLVIECRHCEKIKITAKRDIRAGETYSLPVGYVGEDSEIFCSCEN
jgi:uncharacterized CHY-type Zn-finger protein